MATTGRLCWWHIHAKFGRTACVRAALQLCGSPRSWPSSLIRSSILSLWPQSGGNITLYLWQYALRMALLLSSITLRLEGTAWNRCLLSLMAKRHKFRNPKTQLAKQVLLVILLRRRPKRVTHIMSNRSSLTWCQEVLCIGRIFRLTRV